jgi:BirA family biotin operon repressor/biotin-[acetyl-CoA-carboxylase] ligase
MHRDIDLQIFDSLASTQETAKQINKKKQTLLVVMAHEQTSGKGTFGKSWLSPKDHGLYATFAFEVGQMSSISSLSHLAAVAVCLTLDAIKPTIKWPNDLLIHGKKISGVLTEVIDHHVYTGIGVNLKKDPRLQDLIDQPYTCWEDYKKAPTALGVCEKLIEHFSHLLLMWDQGGFKAIKPLFKTYFELMNQEVMVETPLGLLKGYLIDFSDQGYPILKTGDQIQTLSHLTHIHKSHN